MSPDGWRSRKLWLCLFTFLLTTVLLWLGKVGETSWMTVTGATVISYLTANVAEKWGNGKAAS